MSPSNVTGSVVLDRAAVLARVKEVVAGQLNHSPNALEEGHRLVADLGADSLDLIEIAMELEEEFDTAVPDDVQETQTVGEVADRVMQLLAGAKAE